MRRFFIDGPLTETITIRGGDARHIGRVLRLQPGAAIIVVGAEGQAGTAEIIAVGADEISLKLMESIGCRHEPPVTVWLAQGLPKADKLEYIVQKAVEIGAAGVIPMAVDFSAVRYDESKKKSKVDRWQKIAHEAAKQCGRDLVPAVAAVQSLAEVLADQEPDTAVIMLYEGRAGEGLKRVLADCHTGSYLLLVGPEGGFSAAEVDLCRSKGVHIASMGPRILRTETAALAALAVLLYEKGDLGGDQAQEDLADGD